MKRIVCALGLSLALLGPGQALAEVQMSEQDYNLLGRMGTGKTLDEMEQQLRKRASSWEGDGVPGYTPRDGEVLEQVYLAQVRAREISRALNDDLNGDLVVSSEELRLRARRESLQPLRANGLTVMPSAEQVEYLVEQKMKKALAPDTNGDGALSLEEIAAEADSQLDARQSSRLCAQDLRPSGLVQPM